MPLSGGGDGGACAWECPSQKPDRAQGASHSRARRHAKGHTAHRPELSSATKPRLLMRGGSGLEAARVTADLRVWLLRHRRLALNTGAWVTAALENMATREVTCSAAAARVGQNAGTKAALCEATLSETCARVM